MKRICQLIDQGVDGDNIYTVPRFYAGCDVWTGLNWLRYGSSDG